MSEPAPEPTTDDLQAQVASLTAENETLTAENASLTAQLAAQTGTVATTPVVPVATPKPFDADARLKELLAQGVEETAAIEQAAYEERLWNDQHPAG